MMGKKAVEGNLVIIIIIAIVTWTEKDREHSCQIKRRDSFFKQKNVLLMTTRKKGCN